MFDCNSRYGLKKTLLCIIPFSIFITASAYALQVTLEWEPPACSLDGYALYGRTESNSYNYNRPIYKGENTSHTINIEKDGVTRYFVVRAYRGAEYSEDSNEVSFPDTDFYDGRLNAQWPDKNEDVELTPALLLSYENNALPHTIFWQVSTEKEMSSIVLSTTTDGDNLSLKIPEMVLDTDTMYYWQAKFYDIDGNLICVSDVASFTTVGRDLSDDKDSDGIPDHQKLGKESDLDGDGVPDGTQSDLLCIQTAKGNAGICIKSLSPGAFPVAIKSFDDTDYGKTLNKPKDMIFGLVGFKLFLDEGVDHADVGIFFSKPAPVDSAWYKLDRNEGWTVFEEAAFSANRKSITFTLTDGDPGDEDGIKNGIIVDPSGLGAIEADAAQNQFPDSAGSSNCYINTASAENKPNGAATCALFTLFIVILFGRSARLFIGVYPKR